MKNILLSECERQNLVRLIREATHASHPMAQRIIRTACPSGLDLKAILNVCERLEAMAVADYANREDAA